MELEWWLFRLIVFYVVKLNREVISWFFLKFKVKCKLKKFFSFFLDLYIVFFVKIFLKCVYENMKFIFVYVKMKKKIIESNLMSSLVRNIYKLKKK